MTNEDIIKAVSALVDERNTLKDLLDRVTKEMDVARETIRRLRVGFELHSCPRAGDFCWRCAASDELERVIKECEVSFARSQKG